MRTLQSHVLLVAVIVLSCSSLWSATPQSFDIVITNGHIIDGTGSPWYAGRYWNP